MKDFNISGNEYSSISPPCVNVYFLKSGDSYLDFPNLHICEVKISLAITFLVKYHSDQTVK